MDLRLALRLLDLLDFGSFRFQFRNLDLLLLQFRFHAHSVVLLLLEQQRFQSLRIFLRQLDVPQHHFFDHDAIGRKLLSDHARGALPHLLALCREHIAHCEIRNHLAPYAGYDRRNDFFLHRMRQISLNVVQTFRIEAVAHRDREPQCQSLLGLHIQQLRSRRDVRRRLFSVLRHSRVEDLIARVEQRHVFYQRHHKMHARIERARYGPTHLADPNPSHPARHHYDAERNQNRSPGQQCQRQ